MIRHFPFHFNLKHSLLYARHALPVMIRQYSSHFWGWDLELMRNWKTARIGENIGLGVIVFLLQGHWREGILLLTMPMWGYCFIPQLGLRDQTHHNRAYASIAAWAVFLSAYPALAILMIGVGYFQSLKISKFYNSEADFWMKCYRQWFQRRDDSKLFQDFLSDHSESIRMAYVRILRQKAARAIRDGDMQTFTSLNQRILKIDPDGKIP